MGSWVARLTTPYLYAVGTGGMLFGILCTVATLRQSFPCYSLSSSSTACYDAMERDGGRTSLHMLVTPGWTVMLVLGIVAVLLTMRRAHRRGDLLSGVALLTVLAANPMTDLMIALARYDHHDAPPFSGLTMSTGFLIAGILLVLAASSAPASAERIPLNRVLRSGGVGLIGLGVLAFGAFCLVATLQQSGACSSVPRENELCLMSMEPADGVTSYSTLVSPSWLIMLLVVGGAFALTISRQTHSGSVAAGSALLAVIVFNAAIDLSIGYAVGGEHWDTPAFAGLGLSIGYLTAGILLIVSAGQWMRDRRSAPRPAPVLVA